MKRPLVVFAAIIMCTGMITAPLAAKSVYYNTKTRIYHDHGCDSAKRCTKNCVTIDDSSARSRGGRACYNCGG